MNNLSGIIKFSNIINNATTFLAPRAYIFLTILIMILILMSAFFSASETAFSSVNIIRLKSYVEEKKRGAKKALWIAEHYDRTLSTILVGNNFVNISSTTVAALILTNLIYNPTLANLVTTIGMTIIILIFGEIIPKSYAKEHSESWALNSAGLLYFLIKISYPFIYLFIALKRFFFRKSKIESIPTVTESELETIIETMEDQGVLDSADADWLQGVINIGERTVNDIMVPRVDITGIELSMSVDEIRELFLEFKYSRMPVYNEDKDHIIGVLSERDFWTALYTKNKFDLRTLVKTPLYVSKTLRVDDLIRKMQLAKKHFAIVSDEYGGTSGIVTLEDALEELFGEIYDEHDEDEITEEIKKIDDYCYEIMSDVSVEELFDVLEIGKAPETTYPNIGGFLYSLAEELPTENQIIDYATFVYRNNDDDLLIEIPLTLRFTILSVVERRIIKVKLEIIEHKKDSDENSK